MEQYVDMVLQYLRLSSGENDLVIREYKLDELIREAVRKYAAQFVLKKLRLTYIPTEISVVTDRKWFGCILEQLLSNAIKYTPAGGSIAIRVEEDACTSATRALALPRRTCPGSLRRGIPGKTGAWSAPPADWGCIWQGRRRICCTSPSTWRARWVGERPLRCICGKSKKGLCGALSAQPFFINPLFLP